MGEGLAWSVKGVEPELRRDAARAAGAAGMTLGRWLNGVIRDTLVDLQAEPPAESHPPSSAPVGAVSPNAQREMASPPMPPFQPHHPYAPQQGYPQHQQHQGPPYAQAWAPPPPPPPAYDPYAWAPPPAYAPAPAYAAPAPYAPPYDPVAARLQHYARSGQEDAQRQQDSRLTAVIDALAGIVERAQGAGQEQRQPAPPQQQQQRQPDSDHQEQRRQPPSPPPAPDSGLSDQLAALMQRLASLEESIAARQESRQDAMAEARRIESQLGDALDALGPEPARGAPAGVRPPPGRSAMRPRVNIVRGGAAAAVADIAARQRALDVESEPRALANAENQALEQIRRAIAALAEQVREQRAAPAPASDPGLRAELKDLQKAVEELAPRRIVASVNESIRALAGKIEQSRQEGVRDSQLAPIERMLAELRAAFDRPRETSGLDVINNQLASLSRRIDEFGKRSLANGQAGEFKQHFAELRAMVAEAQNQMPVSALSDQLARLSGKLDDLAQRPGDTRAMAVIAATVEQLRQDIARFNPDRVVALIEDRTAGLDDLGNRIDALAERLEEARTSPVGQLHVDALSQQIERMTHALAQRQAGSDAGPQVARLADRIEQMRLDLAQRGSGAEVADLADRIERMHQDLAQRGPGADIAAVERRIAEVQSLLEKKIPTQPDVKGLEMILRKLAERIEAVRAPGGGEAALDALQSQMVDLARRIDRAGAQSDAAAPGLEGLERTIQDLCQAVGDVRETAAMAAQEAVREVLSQAPLASGAGMDPLAAEGMLLIKRDLTEMKTAQASAENRSQETLQSVASTLEKIVNRLGRLESEALAPRAAVSASAPLQPPPSVQPAAAAPFVESRANPPPPVRSAPPPLAASRIAPEAPSSAGADAMDLPLEPGAGRAAPIAAAEASPADPRASFIAAARRAAQSAATQTTAALADIEKKSGGKEAVKAAAAGKLEGLKATLSARRKPILLSLAIFVLAMGGLNIVNTLLGSDDTPEITNTLPPPSKPLSAAPPVAPKAQVAEAPAPRPAAAPVDPVAVGSIPAPAPAQAASPFQPQPAIAPPLVATTPPPDQPVDVAALMRQTPFSGPERLKQAAANGNLPAIFEVGSRFAEGRGVARDQKAAARWFEYAAAQGYAPAQYRFGSFNREGLGVKQDAKVAFVWFMRAAEQGHVLAMHNLAVLYAEGVAGSPDYAAAASWFRNAAEHGVKDSQFNIAILHVRGLGVAKDLVEAYKWFAVAAIQGDADAIKRREELGAKLTPDQLAEGKAKADEFRAKRPDMRANDVSAPEGGWDQQARPAAGAKKNVRA